MAGSNNEAHNNQATAPLTENNAISIQDQVINAARGSSGWEIKSGMGRALRTAIAFYPEALKHLDSNGDSFLDRFFSHPKYMTWQETYETIMKGEEPLKDKNLRVYIKDASFRALLDLDIPTKEDFILKLAKNGFADLIPIMRSYFSPSDYIAGISYIDEHGRNAAHYIVINLCHADAGLELRQVYGIKINDTDVSPALLARDSNDLSPLDYSFLMRRDETGKHKTAYSRFTLRFSTLYKQTHVLALLSENKLDEAQQCIEDYKENQADILRIKLKGVSLICDANLSKLSPAAQKLLLDAYHNKTSTPVVAARPISGKRPLITNNNANANNNADTNNNATANKKPKLDDSAGGPSGAENITRKPFLALLQAADKELGSVVLPIEIGQIRAQMNKRGTRH